MCIRDSPYLHNPFAITAYYMDEEVPPEPSAQRKASDYEIKWKDRGMETIMRSLLGKEDGPVMSSDLDPVSYTHLDVYKRQVILHVPSLSEEKCAVSFAQVPYIRVRDVYKRQISPRPL